MSAATTPTASPSHLVVVNWKDGEHPEAGGAEVFCENVARELAALGERVTYLTSRPRGAAARSGTDGYAVRRGGGRFTVYPFVLLWLLRHRRQIDGVVDSQNGIPFFSPLAVGADVPVAQVIHHVHQDQFGMYFPGWFAAIGRFLEARAARAVYASRAVCAVSPSTRTEIRRRLRLRGPIHVTPNGVAATEPLRTVSRTLHPSIVCVGRLTHHKRVGLLLDVVAELVRRRPDLHLDVVGAGPEADRLAEQVARLGLGDHVTLHGFTSAAKRDALLASAWLSVSTSVGEGWGLSVVEAAAHGVPTVALDVPGLRDSVRDGVTGWLTDEDGLVDAVDTALSAVTRETDARAIAASCRRWAGSLRWSATAARLRAVLDAERAGATVVRSRRLARQDTSVTVTLTREIATAVDTGRLRTTDQASFCPACVETSAGPFRLLLHGTDELGAAVALRRLGVSVLTSGVQVQLARSSALVQWHAEALAHNEPRRRDLTRCPYGTSVTTDQQELRTA